MASLIVITCDFETVTDRRGAPSPRFVAPLAYVTAIAKAGGDPILLPHVDPKRAEAYLAILDGLVVAGGDFDIPPRYYGEEPREGLGQLLEERSAFEHRLLTLALQRDLPVLGVCGGMQLLNVVLGGTLHQDLRYRPGTAVHVQPHDKRQPAHDVKVTAGSLLGRVTGAMSIAVNITHHQVVNAVGKTLTASGVAEDGVIEAIESPGYRYALGVQWHPEVLSNPERAAIYKGLVEASQRRL
jgi:putative glutamine amidotransferase